MKNTPTPKNSYPARGSFLAVLAAAAFYLLGKLNEALADRFLDWLLSQDWTALIGWCLSQAQCLLWP